MNITLSGIILNSHKFSESSLIITLFTAEKGVVQTMVRGGNSKKQQAVLQLGNVVSGQYKVRLEGQLGSYSKVELLKNYPAKFFSHKTKLLILQSILGLLKDTLYQGEAHEQLYLQLLAFFDELQEQIDLAAYLHFELLILKELGYALALGSCAVSGATEDLHYISPKTGHAVTEIVGKEYHDKLFIIPEFFKKAANYNQQDLEQGFAITDHFFRMHLFEPLNKKLPFARELLKRELG